MKNITVIIVFLFSLNVVSQTVTTNKIVYTTETGTKYHKSSCRYLSKSKIKITMSSAIAAGYSACKICKPGGQTTSTSSVSKSYSSSRCSATTKAGTRCKRSAASGSSTCWQH